jgi:hypothetical protein
LQQKARQKGGKREVYKREKSGFTLEGKEGINEQVLKLNDELKWKIEQRGRRNNDKFWSKAVNWANSNIGHIYAIFWLIGWVMDIGQKYLPEPMCESK